MILRGRAAALVANLAARLTAEAAPGTVLTDAATAELLTGFAIEPLPERDVPGVVWDSLGMNGGSGGASDIVNYKRAVTVQCYDCHGTRKTYDFRPIDAPYRNITSGGFQGTHRTHMTSAATAANCAVCHPGSESYNTAHRDGLIQLATDIKHSPLQTRYNNYSTPFPQTPQPNLGSCTNISCHFEKTTPIWGISLPFRAPADCNRCHGAAPADGSHPAESGPGKKHGDYYGTDTGSCSKCHIDHTNEAAPFAHATSAATRSLNVQFKSAPNDGGLYGGTVNYPAFLPSQNPSRNGTCTELYCHSDGQGGAARTTPVWGGANTVSCGFCHDSASDTTSLSGRHGVHTGPSGYAFSCERCHRDTVSGSDAIIDRSRHVNKTKDVAFREGGNFNGGDKGCSNTYCHSNAAGGPPAFAVKWTDTTAMKCYSCHKGQTGDNTAANCAEIGGTWDVAKGLCAPYLNMTTNGHGRLVGPQWIRKYPCYYCHNATMNTDGTIKDKTRHVNGANDIEMIWHERC